MNPTPAPSFGFWYEFVHEDDVADYRRRLAWWLFCGVWIAIGNVMAIQRGWKRKWPWKVTPLPPVPGWKPHHEYFQPVNWCQDCTVWRSPHGVLLTIRDVTAFVEGVVRCVDPDDIEPGALVQWYQCPRCGHRWSVLDRSGKP